VILIFAGLFVPLYRTRLNIIFVVQVLQLFQAACWYPACSYAKEPACRELSLPS